LISHRVLKAELSVGIVGNIGGNFGFELSIKKTGLGETLRATAFFSN